MRRTSRNNAICFESLEEALAKNPETYGHIDVLCGGWPCQDNSIAGGRKGHAGKKSGLWKELRRIIGIFRPKWLVLENVPGLFSVNGGKDFWAVVSDLNSLGYCVAWNVLDSQFFGVAQRRKRVFIVASFGNIGASKIFFVKESCYGNNQSKQKVGAVGLCLSTRDGEHHDPTRENLVANTLTQKETQQYSGTAGGKRNLVANTIIGKDGRTNHPTNQNTVAFTIGTDLRGQPYKLHTETLIAKADPDGERKTTRFPRGLDSMRGIVIGNAVTVNVAKWIGQRIMEYELTHRKGCGDGEVYKEASGG